MYYSRINIKSFPVELQMQFDFVEIYNSLLLFFSKGTNIVQVELKNVTYRNCKGVILQYIR